MKLFTKEVPRSFRLYCLGDTHIGSEMSTHSGITKAVAMIKADPQAYAVFMGDGVEGISINDKRFDLDTLDKDNPVPKMQVDKLASLLEPIKEQLVVYLFGNHDLPLLSEWGDIAEEVCERVGRPEIYGTASCKVTFKTSRGKILFKGYFTHGRRAVTSAARDPLQRETQYKVRLKNLMGPLAGDCALMVRGHNHRLVIGEPSSELYLKDDGRRLRASYTTTDYSSEFIHPDLRWYGCAGSFYRTFGVLGKTSYAERAEYPPTETGMIRFDIENGQIINGEKIIID